MRCASLLLLLLGRRRPGPSASSSPTRRTTPSPSRRRARWRVTTTVPVGDRPRGIVLSKDGKSLYICASDSDHIEVLDLATLTVDAHPAERPGPGAVRAQPGRRRRSTSPTRTTTWSPCSTSPSARIVDRDPGRRRAGGHGRQPRRQDRWSTRPKPPAWRISSTPRRTRSSANVLVGSRPRVAPCSPPTARRSGCRPRSAARSSVIDAGDAQGRCTRSTSRSPACRPRAIQPVGIALTHGRHARLRGARPGQPRRGGRRARPTRCKKYLLVGQRVWNLAFSCDGKRLYTTNGVSNDMSVIDVDALRVHEVGAGRAACPGAWWWHRDAARRPPAAERRCGCDGLTPPLRQPRRAARRQLRASPRATSRCCSGPNGAGKTTLFALITRLYHAQPGPHRGVRPRLPAPIRGGAGAHGRGVPAADARSRPDGRAEPALPRRPARHARAAPRRADRRRNWSASGWPSGGATGCGCCPAASGAGSSWRARCCTSRRCCCWTSRPPGSTSKAAASCSHHVRRLCAERGLAVLWATHLIDEAGDEARVVVLHQGRVLADGAGAAGGGRAPARPTLAATRSSG